MRGLAAILPTLVTLWLLIWVWDFLWQNIGQYILNIIRIVWDDLIEQGRSLGLNIRMNTKYWAEQVGLPYHPSHIRELNQFERRHS